MQTGAKETIISSRLNSIMGMAVDWIGRNLYWTDEGLRAIFVASLENPEKRLLLLSENLTHPRSITVDPTHGVMYWTNWPPGPPIEAETQGQIEVAWLDGSHREIFIDESIIWPNGLSLDFEAGRIYWCDSYLQKIESASILAGSKDRKVHLTEATLSQPYGLTLHKKAIFWSEFEKGRVLRLDLTTSNVSVVLEENPQSFDLKVFDPDRQPRVDHPCNNGGHKCSDLCLVVPEKGQNGGHTCRCRDGSTLLAEDGVTCQAIANWTPPSHCRANQFQCKTNLKCIDERYV